MRRFGKGLLCVFRALLDGQRIVFLGHAQTAETVCMAVLSCPLLVCPPLEGLLERCFPYTSLKSLDFLEVAGFVAGTTNPIFESHPEWWDVLCDLDASKVWLSGVDERGKKTKLEPPKQADLDELDRELYEQLSGGIEARYSEHWLRACFQEHAQQLVAERHRGSAMLAASRRDADAPSAEMAAVLLEQLRSGSRVSEKEMVHILSQLVAFAANEARLTRLLAMLPAASPLGPLAPLATALFHPNVSVRGLAATLLRTVEGHRAAKPCVTGLNAFLLSGFQQQPHTSGFA